MRFYETGAPQADTVAILRDGKVHHAIEINVKTLVTAGHNRSATMTPYESFIHPLLCFDKKIITCESREKSKRIGRTSDCNQRVFSDKIWKNDVV